MFARQWQFGRQSKRTFSKQIRDKEKGPVKTFWQEDSHKGRAMGGIFIPNLFELWTQIAVSSSAMGKN